MTQVIRVKRCAHCGTILQTEDPNKKGFINQETIDANKPNALLLCNECFKTVSEINITSLDDSVDKGILTILNDAVATDAYIIWVVDLFAFSGYLNPEVMKKIRNLKISVFATKRDLFSKNIKDETFIRFIHERFNESGIKLNNVKICSANEDINGYELIKFIENERQGHDVYMLGSLSSGKTTIINKLMQAIKNKSQWVIKTEQYPGTDIKVLEIPLSKSSFLYELPGFGLNNNTLSLVEKEVANYLVPKKKIVTHTKLLSYNDTIIIGNLAYITLKSDITTSVKLYCGDKVEIKKTKEKHINEVNAENARKRNLRPYSEKFVNFTDYDVYSFKMDNDEQIHDIDIKGVGWFSFVAKGQTFYLSVPKGIFVKENLGKIRD